MAIRSVPIMDPLLLISLSFPFRKSADALSESCSSAGQDTRYSLSIILILRLTALLVTKKPENQLN